MVRETRHRFATEASRFSGGKFATTPVAATGCLADARKEQHMPTVFDVLSSKGTQVHYTTPDQTVLEATQQMNQHKLGALLVMEDGKVTGMFTERDVLQRIVAHQRDANTTPVREVMTTEVACCRPHTTLEEARGVMKNRRIRHLPVIDQDDGLVALVSIGDLNAYEANSQEMTIHLLHQYIYGQG